MPFSVTACQPLGRRTLFPQWQFDFLSDFEKKAGESLAWAAIFPSSWEKSRERYKNHT